MAQSRGLAPCVVSQSVVMNSFSSESSVSDLLLAFKALFDKIVHRKEGKECGGKSPGWT